jgi:hypothetical protein
MAVVTRPIQRVDYESGQTTRVELPRNHFYNRLRLAVTKGTLSGGSGGSYVADAGDKFIKNIELVIGGQMTKERLSMQDLKKLNLLTYRDNEPGEGYAFLDLGMLPSHLFTSLDLHITWEDLANLNDGDRTSAGDSYVDIQARETLNEGQDIGDVPLVLHKTTIKDVANKSGEVTIDLRTGNVLQAALVIPSSTSLINHIDILQDGTKYHRKKEIWDDLREDNKLEFELDNAPSDWAVLNFDAFGEGSQALRTKQMESLDLVADINSESDGEIRVVTVEIAQPS